MKEQILSHLHEKISKVVKILPLTDLICQKISPPILGFILESFLKTTTDRGLFLGPHS